MAAACTAGLDTGFVALGYAKVAFLGVVQGLTELLPISSTAHMRIAALAAVMSYFWPDVRGLVFGSLNAVKRRDFTDWNVRFAIWIVLATLPILVAGVLLAPLLNACDSPLRSLTVIGISCLVMAALLGLAEVYSTHSRTLNDVTIVDALVIGVAQIGALIPGVSRSGSTLTAALFRDLERAEAARFSFLLGLPAIAAAGFKELWELHKAHLEAQGWAILAVGLVVASVSAFAAIWSLMRILERFSAWPFVFYRGFIGAVLLLGVAVGWLAN
jgi:undecaprenyl-diphosphatase